MGGERGEWMRGLGLGWTNSVGTGGVLDVCLCFGGRGVGGVGGVGGEWVVGEWVGGEWVCGLDQCLEEWGGVISVWGVSLDYMCRWQV